MRPKKRILATLARQPVDLWHTPEIAAVLQQHGSVADDIDMRRGADDAVAFRSEASRRKENSAP